MGTLALATVQVYLSTSGMDEVSPLFLITALHLMLASAMSLGICTFLASVLELLLKDLYTLNLSSILTESGRIDGNLSWTFSSTEYRRASISAIDALPPLSLEKNKPLVMFSLSRATIALLNQEPFQKPSSVTVQRG